MLNQKFTSLQLNNLKENFCKISFLITNDVNKTYNKIFKIIDSYYGHSRNNRKYSDKEIQLHEGYLIGFNVLRQEVIEEIKLLKYVEVI